MAVVAKLPSCTNDATTEIKNISKNNSKIFTKKRILLADMGVAPLTKSSLFAFGVGSLSFLAALSMKKDVFALLLEEYTCFTRMLAFLYRIR